MSPFKFILFFAMVAGIGFLLLPRIPVDLLPSSTAPVLTIHFGLRDAPPEIVEQEATAPLENALSQLSDLKRIYSVSKHERGTIELRFDPHADIDVKKFEASSIIRHLRHTLNPEITYPVIHQQSASDEAQTPLLVYRISARLAPFQIRALAENVLITPLSQHPGVNEVATQGAEEIQLTIAYEPEKLQQFEIEPNTISTEIQTSFSTFFPGTLLTSNQQRFVLKGGRGLENIGELENLIIKSTNGRSYRLKELASIYFEERKASQFFRVNGLSTVTLNVHADEGVNRLALGNELKEKISQLKPSLPQGFELRLDYDDTEFVQKEIDKNLFRSCLSFLILIAFLSAGYRSLPHIIILFSGIVVTLGLLALTVFISGIKIHLYTIAGVTIALGTIIDNSIVVLDHLQNRLDKKIFRAVLAASITSIMALVLVFFLPEQDRQNLGDFCMVVSLAIGCSLVTACFYTPAANTLFLKPRDTGNSFSFSRKRVASAWFKRYSGIVILVANHRRIFLLLCILSFGLPVFLLPARWEDHEFYNKTIGSTFYQERIRPITDPLLGGTLRWFVRDVYDRSGYREEQRTRLYVNAELPYGHTPETMNSVMEGMEKYLGSVEGIDTYITQVYSGQYASIVVNFKGNQENGSLPYVLRSRLISLSLDWGAVQWEIYGVGQGFSNSSSETIPTFNVNMKGYNYDELALHADVLAKKLLAHKRIQKVNTNERLGWDEKNSEQLVINLANSNNHSPQQIASELHKHAESSFPTFFLSMREKLYPTYVTALREKKLTKYDIMQTPLVTSDSQLVRLSTLGKIASVKTSDAIHKENRSYIRVVGFEYFGNYTFGNRYLDQVLKEMKSELPPGYEAIKRTYRWGWDQVKRQYGLILILAIAIYFIASILFENLKQPFYITVLLPLSFIGLFLTFSLFDIYFDQGGYAAFILLGGLVVNASIYIVNDVNNSTRRNTRAMLKAVVGKMKPVLLTIASTVLGLVPFMIGGQQEVFWFALAAGTTGGLLFSILILFIFLPVCLVSGKQSRHSSL